jgi:transcription initiation factor IIE alpha subunit
MRTSEAHGHGFICPKCGKKLTQDLKHRGFVRHKERNEKGEICEHRLKEKD